MSRSKPILHNSKIIEVHYYHETDDNVRDIVIINQKTITLCFSNQKKEKKKWND